VGFPLSVPYFVAFLLNPDLSFHCKRSVTFMGDVTNVDKSVASSHRFNPFIEFNDDKNLSFGRDFFVDLV
jgi:hypothetical protein